MKNIFKDLNPSQKEAVEHIDGSLLILAGAGTGKTKTLTSRLAYLIGVVGIDPRATLTLTFTNKASLEMRNRAVSLLKGRCSAPPALYTFHKFGLLFLKFHINKLGRKNNFVIIDSDDKKKLIKEIIKDMNIDLDIGFINNEISKYKNSLISVEIAKESAELLQYKKLAVVYERYQKTIIDNNLVDFDDLLMLPYQILKSDDELRIEISNRYQYVMVDEYQDTNELQFKILELLVSEHGNLCVVGDDDQSIYGWRGANIRNILEFHKNFENTKIVKLETNYRSTTPILDIANSLIEHNSYRLGKKLLSHRGDGKKVELSHCLDEMHEARFIAKEVKRLINSGVDAKEIAVLYRINALSRSLEDGFNREGLSFKLLGGMRFYERAEIKDLISYLRTILNPNDDFSLLRIINKPKRGVGKVSLDKIQNEAYSQKVSIYEYIYHTSLEDITQIVSKKVAKNLKDFANTIQHLKALSEENPSTFIDVFDKIIALKDIYNNRPDTMERIQNIDEFYGYFNDTFEKFPNATLEEFLNDISLQSDQDNIENSSITIMSIHASKGLEFEHVFVIGLEEEFFPLLGEGTDMSEERRLGYVAITRAKTNLTLCYVDSRFYKGKRKQMDKSRFLGECGIIKNTSLKVTKSSGFKKGDPVRHKIFGMGIIQGVTKVGKDYRLKINFAGTKKDILSSFVQAI
ncbi:ATP-dependent DNA helicase UvrD/PcrA/Rep, epsilon proteobacterial type 2 [hydrothermal vent metagenome]|uniref:DNA 3'-5' helicase n=1 Tax=hydrothermal vent metagenome TaxID=652676 RepID=A0A1W1EIK1_9ZZZZ